MDPADLERLAGQALSRLPAPRAPETLLPRVMAAAAAPRPWYRRAWLDWPVGWQLASAALLAAMVTAAAWWLPSAVPVEAASSVASARGELSDAAARIDLGVSAVRVLWRALVAPVVPYALGLLLVMCLACAVFGTALNHLVFGRAFR